jgi:membrane-associated phospholipid phosphatase
MILPYFNTQRFDEILIQIDFSMFGTHPTVWIERFISPMLTEIMYILYLFYFPMPIIVMVLLYRNNRLKEIEEGFFIFLSCYYLAYTIYFIVPASGPRFYLHEFQTIPLDGYFLSNPIRELINKLEPNKLDAFPSLHAGIVMSTMIVSYKFARRMFNIFVPIVIGITISLVYCRYHYVIDIIGGFLVSIISYQISSRIYKVIHKNTIFHFRLPLQ